jgi:hypothetical protein
LNKKFHGEGPTIFLGVTPKEPVFVGDEIKASRQFFFDCEDRGLSAVFDAKLAENILQGHLYGLWREPQNVRYFLVRPTAS